MAPLEVQVTVSSAKDLKNVNWRHGDLKPYAVVWVDPAAKCSTRVDDRNDTHPVWDEKLTIPLHDRRVEDSTLCIDIVHAEAHDDTKPLIGSARIPLEEIVDEAGLGEKCYRSLNLKRPSGRPQGKLQLEIVVREPRYSAPPPAAYAPPYGQTSSRDYSYATPYGQASSRDYSYAPPYGQAPSPYSAAPPAGYPSNYGQAGYGQPAAYGQAGYGQPAAYGQPAYGQAGQGVAPEQQKKGSKFGVGTGLAVGAAAGILGGLAIAGGVDYVEDKIADDVTERVENDLAYDDGDDDF